MGKKAFVVYRRKSGKKKSTFYAAFLNSETGDYNKRCALYDDSPYHKPITNKQSAEIAALKIWDSGGATKSSEEIGSYLSGFWSADGDYVAGRAKAGRPLSVAYAFDMRRCIELYVVPWLKNPRVLNPKTKKWEDRPSIESLAIDRWTPGHGEDLMKYLSDKEGLSPGRANDVRKSISTALGRYWRRKGHKDKNPMRGVDRYFEEQPKRFIFSAAEVRKFFARKMDPRLWTINALAATGGLRLGECLGLSPEALSKETVAVGKQKLTVYAVEVREKGNWQPKEGLKDPKGKSTGKVYIPPQVGQALEKLIAANRWRNNFVFFGTTNEKPFARETVEEEFNRICHAIGIPEEERLRRKLTFHAWRHYYEARRRGRMPDHVLREQMRHKSLPMTERYSHVTEEQAHLVKQIAAEMF